MEATANRRQREEEVIGSSTTEVYLAGREREKERKIERASEPGTHELRSDSDSSAATNSRSVKRRDDGGGDPARHGRPRTNGCQSRLSGGRDKDERRDPFRRAKRSAVRSARRSCRGTTRRKETRNNQRYLKNAASRSRNFVLHLVLRTPVVPIPKKTEGI